MTPMLFRSLLATAFLFIAGFYSLAADRPPNVILILIDDMGWTDLSCYGSKFYETPNIDRLAASGMRLTHGYSACTVCSPTRAAVMTGKYPARLHITDWITGLTVKGLHLQWYSIEPAASQATENIVV
jgi:arylsulfatase A-like enzyme